METNKLLDFKYSTAELPHLMMITLRNSHYLVHGAIEALRHFFVSMSSCGLLILVVC